MMFFNSLNSADVVVIGAGPAACAAAAACASRGLDVIAVAPSPRRPWTACYGMWKKELPDALAASIEVSWPATRVSFGQGDGIDLAEGYVRLSTAWLQYLLAERTHRSGVRWVDGVVVDVAHDARQSQVLLRGGRGLRATLVIDASGAKSRHVRRIDARKPAFQSAYGELVKVRSHPYDTNQMRLMDFGDNSADDTPTFLYAQPFDDRHLFVEETSLVARTPHEHADLRSRLRRRLAKAGVVVTNVLARERCVIPMGISPPVADQRVVAFGAAAGFVHPATGYQLARSLRSAEPLAEAIVTGLDRGQPRIAARRAFAAIWPAALLRSWELYTFGMNVLSDFDAARMRQFMRTFFTLPPASWLRYLQGQSQPSEVAWAMLQLFGRASPELRSTLLRFGTGTGLTTLLRAATPRMTS